MLDTFFERSYAIAHSHVDPSGFLAIGAVLVGAAVVSLSVIRRGVRADELALIQGLSQAIAGDISLARSFPRRWAIMLWSL